jgi:hypothetical protein
MTVILATFGAKEFVILASSSETKDLITTFAVPFSFQERALFYSLKYGNCVPSP